MAIPFVLNITGGEDALDTGLGGSGYSEDVAVFIGGELVPDKGGGGFVACIIRIFLLVRGMSGLTNSVEETVDLELALLTGLGVFELEALKEVAVALALGRDGLYISTYPQAKPSLGENLTFQSTVTLGCAVNRLAMILDARSSLRRTRT